MIDDTYLMAIMAIEDAHEESEREEELEDDFVTMITPKTSPKAHTV